MDGEDLSQFEENNEVEDVVFRLLQLYDGLLEYQNSYQIKY